MEAELAGREGAVGWREAATWVERDAAATAMIAAAGAVNSPSLTAA
jgi:hypothetical protein